MAEPAFRLFTYDEYLELERVTGVRYELLDGYVYAMSGGTPRHSKIKVNLAGLLWSALRGRPCRPYDSDLKIVIAETGLVTYPDLTVVYGPVERAGIDPNAVTNPVALFEVLSPSTADWDLGTKFRSYLTIPTVRHVVYVDPEVDAVYHYQRDGLQWILTSHGSTGPLDLPAIGVCLDLAELFRDLPAEPEAGEPKKPVTYRPRRLPSA